MRFRYRINGKHNDLPCVYRLNFGSTRYYIWKGKELKQSVEVISKDVDRFLASCPADHLLSKVLEYVLRARVLFFTVDVLLQTDDIARLIDFENKELAKASIDPNCLNKKFEAHISTWMASALNKPITDTFSGQDVRTPAPRPELKPQRPVNSSTGQSSLLSALAKVADKK